MGGNKDQDKRNEADHQSHLNHWEQEKKSDNKWLSKEEYERKTGKPGRK
jgi:hypothetical protein